jgi:hypothetical protein
VKDTSGRERERIMNKRENRAGDRVERGLYNEVFG